MIHISKAGNGSCLDKTDSESMSIVKNYVIVGSLLLLKQIIKTVCGYSLTCLSIQIVFPLWRSLTRWNNKVQKTFHRHIDPASRCFESFYKQSFTYKIKPVQSKAIKGLQTLVTEIQCPRVLCILVVILKNDRCLPKETPWCKIFRGN
jgi:hypothetical protein